MKNKFNKGDKVKIHSEHLETYGGLKDFRNQTFVISEVCKSELDHPLFDGEVGQTLYDLWDIEEDDYFSCSLYEYELERA